MFAVQALLALALRALARRADVHHQLGAARDLLLGEREGAGVERVRELLVVLGDHAGAAAGGAVELDELDVQQRRDPRHRAVQLRGEAAAHAAGPVRDLHLFGLLSSGSCPPAALAAVALAGLRLLLFAHHVEVELVALLAVVDVAEDPLDLLRGLVLVQQRAAAGVTLPRCSARRITGSELSSSGTARGWNLPP